MTEARLASARLQIEGLKTTYRQQLAELQSATASAEYDRLEYASKKALVGDGWTPGELYDRADTDLKVAGQHVVSIARQIANIVVALDGDPNGLDHVGPTSRGSSPRRRGWRAASPHARTLSDKARSAEAPEPNARWASLATTHRMFRL